MSAEIRPRTVTVPLVGLVIPATSLSAVLLPEPFRPMIPYVVPAATLKERFLTAGKVSVGLRSRRTLRCSRALLSVANCRPL